MKPDKDRSFQYTIKNILEGNRRSGIYNRVFAWRLFFNLTCHLFHLVIWRPGLAHTYRAHRELEILYPNYLN